jgi:hypothetical protein
VCVYSCRAQLCVGWEQRGTQQSLCPIHHRTCLCACSLQYLLLQSLCAVGRTREVPRLGPRAQRHLCRKRAGFARTGGRNARTAGSQKHECRRQPAASMSSASFFKLRTCTESCARCPSILVFALPSLRAPLPGPTREANSPAVTGRWHTSTDLCSCTPAQCTHAPTHTLTRVAAAHCPALPSPSSP